MYRDVAGLLVAGGEGRRNLFRTLAAGFVRLERAQEVDEVLAFRNLQPVEMVNDLIGLAILALVGFDSLH